MRSAASSSAIERLARSLGDPSTTPLPTQPTAPDDAELPVALPISQLSAAQPPTKNRWFSFQRPQPSPVWWHGLMQEPVAAPRDFALISHTGHGRKPKRRGAKRFSLSQGLVWFSLAIILAMLIAPFAIGHLVQQLAP